MSLFETKLRATFNNLLSESYEGRRGYVVVVDCKGIGPDWVLEIGCEVVIPDEEFELYADSLRDFNILPPKETELSIEFPDLERLYEGYRDANGITHAGIFYPLGGTTAESIALRDNLRRVSMTASEFGPGMYEKITKKEYDELVFKWRAAGFSVEGEWENGLRRHGPGDPESATCPYCIQRFSMIGGGIPLAGGELIPPEEIARKRRKSLTEGGYCCGDPVRPKYFGYRKSRARKGTPEWLQYQYSEVVHLVLKEYEQDIIEAIAERFGLNEKGHEELRSLVFKEAGLNKIPSNFEFKEPQQRYTKRYAGPPPHMQHRELESPKNVWLGGETFRTYYQQVRIHLDPLNSFSFGGSSGENPWVKMGTEYVEEEEVEGEESYRSYGYSGFKEHLFKKATKLKSGVIDTVDPEPTKYTYTSPNGQEYKVFKISTGIKGLNFLTDSFMPPKQSEIERRPKYHGKKTLPTLGKDVEGELLGLHMSEMYGASGYLDGRIVYADLRDYFREMFGINMAPWHSVKPFPIDHNGNIYFIEDDDVLVLPKSVCPCTGEHECCKDESCPCKKASGACRKTKEISGKILKIEFDKTDPKQYRQILSITMLVNANACVQCASQMHDDRIAAEEAEEKGDLGNSERHRRREARRKEKYGRPHEHTFNASKHGYMDINKADFETEGVIQNSHFIKDADTYALYTKPWMILNMKRLERASSMGHPIEHPYKKGKQVSSEEFLELINQRVTKNFKRTSEEKNPKKRGKLMRAFTKKAQRDLIRAFRALDSYLLNPDNPDGVKYGENIVDISNLDWMDKIAIPINFSDEPPFTLDLDDADSITEWNNWLTAQHAISTDLFFQVMPHSIIKKHLGIPQEEDLQPITKAGDEYFVPYILSGFKVEEDETEKLNKDALELIDKLTSDVEGEEEKEEEEEEDKGVAEVELGPGGSPYAPEPKPEPDPESLESYFDYDDYDDDEDDEDDDDSYF
jgi:hypothetical protein